MSLRLFIIVLWLFLIGNTAYASPCARLKSQPAAWVESKVNELVLAAHKAYERDEALPAYVKAVGEINDTIRQCQLSQNVDFVSRYREFVEYLETVSLEQEPSHKLGFIVPDGQYFAETSQYVQIPEFLLEPSFLQSVSRYETLDRAKSFLQSLNSKREPSDQLIFFSYKSRHLGTPDNNNSYHRLLIVVPGNAELGTPEKWVQFGITDPGGRVRVRNVSVVSVVTNFDGTSNTYFKDYYRTYRRDGSISLYGRWELGYGAGNCVKCHKSGILPIFPVDGSVKPSEQQAVLDVNQRFLKYGSPRFGRYFEAGRLGPGLASANWSDRMQRFGQDFGETGVARAMSCANCHRPDRLGALNWPMNRVVISSYIKGGRMPLGYSLTVPERSELYEKLIEEYFAIDDTNPGILKSWLLGRLR